VRVEPGPMSTKPDSGTNQQRGGSENTTGVDRRTPAIETVKPGQGPDRRHADAGSPTGLERRRGPGRRLSDFIKAAEEGEMNQEQFLFLVAIDAFKKANGKTYPSWTDVLEVIRLLGYRKTQASQLRLNNAEDWQESADAPAEVRPKKPGEKNAKRDAA